MNVYILQHRVPYEGTDFHGVYSTREMAEQAKRSLISRKNEEATGDGTHYGRSMEIVSVQVDVPYDPIYGQ